MEPCHLQTSNSLLVLDISFFSIILTFCFNIILNLIRSYKVCMDDPSACCSRVSTSDRPMVSCSLLRLASGDAVICHIDQEWY